MSRELILEAVRAMLGLESIRVDCNVFVEGTLPDERGTRNYTLIVVGEDHYQSGEVDGSEVAEHVRAILGEPRECLNLRGTEYVRDPRHGDWLRLIPRDERRARASWYHELIVSDSVTDERSSPFSEEQNVRLHLVLGADPAQMETYDRLGTDEVDHLPLLHVLGQSTRTMAREQIPDIGDFKKSMLDMTPETLANVEKAFSSMPNVSRQTLELWIDERTRFIHRLESVYEGSRDGRLVHRQRDTRVYTLFNAAQLPGPLPE